MTKNLWDYNKKGNTTRLMGEYEKRVFEIYSPDDPITLLSNRAIECL